MPNCEETWREVGDLRNLESTKLKGVLEFFKLLLKFKEVLKF